MSHFVLKVFLDLMKLSEVWKAGEQSNYRINWDVSNEAIVYIYLLLKRQKYKWIRQIKNAFSCARKICIDWLQSFDVYCLLY